MHSLADFSVVVRLSTKTTFLLVCLGSWKKYRNLSIQYYHCVSYITAAHCIRGTNLVQSRFTATSVRLGEWNLLSDNDCEDVSVMIYVFLFELKSRKNEPIDLSVVIHNRANVLIQFWMWLSLKQLSMKTTCLNRHCKIMI